ILIAGFTVIGYCMCTATSKSALSDVTDDAVSVRPTTTNQIGTQPTKDDVDVSQTSTKDQTGSNVSENTKQPLKVQPKTTEIITDNDQDNNKADCNDLMTAAVSDYNHEVAAKKSDLDSSIKF